MRSRLAREPLRHGVGHRSTEFAGEPILSAGHLSGVEVGIVDIHRVGFDVERKLDVHVPPELVCRLHDALGMRATISTRTWPSPPRIVRAWSGCAGT